MPRRQKRSEAGVQFGTTVRRLRKGKGLSQEALAEKAGLAADYVGFIERGENVPSLIAILKLARALEVDTAELVADFTLRKLRSTDL
jgi:transcriptional regulator with XRE-family HTH domain